MKRFIFAAVCAALALPAQVSLAAAPAAAAKTTWQLATGYRQESFHGQNLLSFAADVAAATQGQLNISLQPNNSVFKLAEIHDAVQSGKVAAGEVIMSAIVKEVPVAGADSVPFVVDSYAKAARMWAYQRPLVDARMAKRGLTVLYAVPWPPQGLYSTKPIKSAADLRGAKMRTYNPATVRIAELTSATGIDIPMVDVGAALAAGRMDSMITSAVTGVENKVWDHLKYYYEINAWFPKNLVFVNTTAFAALTTEQQAAVRKAAQTAELRGWELSSAAASSSMAELKARGVTVQRTPPALENDLKVMGERFTREWIRKVGNEANNIFLPFYTRDK